MDARVACRDRPFRPAVTIMGRAFHPARNDGFVAGLAPPRLYVANSNRAFGVGSPGTGQVRAARRCHQDESESPRAEAGRVAAIRADAQAPGTATLLHVLPPSVVRHSVLVPVLEVLTIQPVFSVTKSITCVPST
jgi:hypothetical protein